MILPFIREEAFSEVFDKMYGSSHFWLVWTVLIPSLVISFMIVIFTGLLIRLHIKLIKTDFTAYEYLVYKSEKKEVKKDLKCGNINEEDYKKQISNLLDRENRKKRSKIIH